MGVNVEKFCRILQGEVTEGFEGEQDLRSVCSVITL